MARESSIKMVVLDWAGTTLDFGCLAPSGAFVRAFAKRGLVVTIAEARAPMGLHKKDHLREMLRSERIGRAWEAERGRAWLESDVDDLYRLVTPMQVAAAALHSELVPNLLGDVQKLRDDGIKIAGSTGYFVEAANVCYARSAEQGYVPDFTICADEVPAGRPAPWMIFRCMEAMGIYPPSAVAKVGDTVVDIRDGLNAGVWSIGVVDSSNEMGLSVLEFESLSSEDREDRRSRIRKRFRDVGAHAVVDTLTGLPAALARLQMSPIPR